MLTAYETQVYQLLQAPSSPNALLPTATIDSFINTARGQIAGEGECIRAYSTLAVVPDGVFYPFTSVVLGGPPGTAGITDVRMVTYRIASGYLRVNQRPWEWFNNYVLSKAVPFVGAPKYWAQFGQGEAGNIAVNFLDFTYTLFLDCVCYPIALANDTTPEAIPYPWTDAVQFFAAWLAFKTLQKEADAKNMFELYERFMQRARSMSTPSVTPQQFSQASDPTLPAKLGVTQGRQQPQAA